MAPCCGLARDLPRPETALDAARRPGLTLQDRGGVVFATFGDLVGEPLRLADMPRCLPAAAVAVEDRRYWSHGAIDVVGIGRRCGSICVPGTWCRGAPP